MLGGPNGVNLRARIRELDMAGGPVRDNTMSRRGLIGGICLLTVSSSHADEEENSSNGYSQKKSLLRTSIDLNTGSIILAAYFSAIIAQSWPLRTPTVFKEIVRKRQSIDNLLLQPQSAGVAP